MRFVLQCVCVTVLPVVLSGCIGAKPVTTETLLAEMTDLAGLAEFPDPPFTCRQFSSYDRKSEAVNAELPAEARGTSQDPWFANADWGQFLRVEDVAGRQEYVMMDAAGPGAIVRIWSANPKGTLRIYLDGDPKPVIEAPMTDFLGARLPDVPAPIAGERSAGWNSYFPIPYARHCKVTSDHGGFYYHINYRSYSPATAQVVSFRPTDFSALKEKIAAVAAHLASPDGCLVEPARPDMKQAAGEPLGAGESLPPGELQKYSMGGPGAIVAFRVKVEAQDPEQAWRQLLLGVVFDGYKTIDCPLGDFFGAGPGVNSYCSLPMGVTPEGEMWSHWVMPFREYVFLTIRNAGDQTVRVSHRVAIGDYPWTDRTMYFHAGWRQESDVPSRPMRDWNYCLLRGKGVFAGAAFSVANPVRHWWGEGDEKIYVDGEKFPSHFGTGTEDYYGYAWCNSKLFMHAYHNQPRCDGPLNYGCSAVNRWHILDRIPFEREFRFDMELWHADSNTKTTNSVVTYWYGLPGSAGDYQPIEDADLVLTPVPPYQPQNVAGAIEGESLAILEQTGTVEPQKIWDCSGDQQMWWRDAWPGEKLVLGFNAPSAGRYGVLARMVKAPDYGIVRLWINDQPAGEPIDLYSEHLGMSEELKLGEFDLPAGENRLTVEIDGAHEKAAKKFMFGLDYLRLEAMP